MVHVTMSFTKLSYLAVSPDGENWLPMNPNAIVVPTGESIGPDSYFELYCRPLTRLNAAGDLQYEPLFPEDLDLSTVNFFRCAAEGHSSEGVYIEGALKTDLAPLGSVHPHLWHHSRPTARDDLILQCNPSLRENQIEPLDNEPQEWNIGSVGGDASSLADAFEEACNSYAEGLFRYRRFEAACEFLTQDVNSALYVQHVREEIFDDMKMWRNSLDSLLASLGDKAASCWEIGEKKEKRPVYEPLSRKVDSLSECLPEYRAALARIRQVLEFISSRELEDTAASPLPDAETTRLRARASAIWDIAASLPEESFVLGRLTPPRPRPYFRVADLPEAIRLRSKNSPNWITKGQTAARKAGAGIDMPMRLLIQFTKHWNAFPEHREDMLRGAPPEVGDAVHRAALAAVVHSLCERDGAEIPEWVSGVHAGGEYLINGDIADTEYGRLIKAQSPAVCSNYGVYFEKEMLASR